MRQSETLSIQIGGNNYKSMAIQPMEAIEVWQMHWPREVAWHLGNVIKYVARAGTKDDIIQELNKAIHYLERAKELLKGRQA